MRRNIWLFILFVALISGSTVIASGQDLSTVTPPPGTCNAKWGLGTSQNAWPGYITIATDCENLYISFNLWLVAPLQPTFGNLHIWVGNDLYNLPMDAQGMPAPNQFCSALGGKCISATGLTSYTWAVPLAELNLVDISKLYNTDLYIVTIAEVDMDGNPATPYEIAYGGNYVGQGGPQWWSYGVFQICCNNLPGCNMTAFAKGGWVWTTDAKSNPEGLPSLMLTKNRWGWAINLETHTVPGTPATFPIYAGAGLNYTSKGKLVGTLEVAWDGANVSVRYLMLSGYMLEEIHIYAGDTPPTTTAPGQYGYVDSFEPSGASSVGPIGFAVSDSNGDGIWVVGHAVVKVPCKK